MTAEERWLVLAQAMFKAIGQWPHADLMRESLHQALDEAEELAKQVEPSTEEK